MVQDRVQISIFLEYIVFVSDMTVVTRTNYCLGSRSGSVCIAAHQAMSVKERTMCDCFSSSAHKLMGGSPQICTKGHLRVKKTTKK